MQIYFSFHNSAIPIYTYLAGFRIDQLSRNGILWGEVIVRDVQSHTLCCHFCVGHYLCLLWDAVCIPCRICDSFQLSGHPFKGLGCSCRQSSCHYTAIRKLMPKFECSLTEVRSTHLPCSLTHEWQLPPQALSQFLITEGKFADSETDQANYM